jgi:hypothetical protein
MAEQPISGKTIVFVAVVLAAVVGAHMMLQVDDERTNMGNSGPAGLTSGDSADQLDPTSLEKRVEDNTRMLLTGDRAQRVKASRMFAELLDSEEGREQVQGLQPEAREAMKSALSQGKGDSEAQVRENCREAWANLHVVATRTDELP